MKGRKPQSSKNQSQNAPNGSSQPSVLSWITGHQIDLTKASNKRDLRPRQYVWVSFPMLPTYPEEKEEEQEEEGERGGGRGGGRAG